MNAKETNQKRKKPTNCISFSIAQQWFACPYVARASTIKVVIRDVVVARSHGAEH